MLNIEIKSEEISKNLKSWLNEAGRNIVVGIDGYSGAGKTTLLKYLADRNDFIKPVYMDDYVSTANTKENLIPKIENNSSQLDLTWEPVDGIEKIRKIIIDFRSEQGNDKVLVVEGIFLFHTYILNDLWDKRIFLDINKNEADARRVTREKERFGDKYFPETHPDSFTRLFKIAFKRYEELFKPRETADYVINL